MHTIYDLDKCLDKGHVFVFLPLGESGIVRIHILDYINIEYHLLVYISLMALM